MQHDLSEGEDITKISGYYDKLKGGQTVIRSLTFDTNERSLGPFGANKGTYFEKKAPGKSKIVGFHGRSGRAFLYSIGIYAK